MVRQLKRRTVARKSLTALCWINPKAWHLSKQEISEALNIPVERVKNATCRQHQVCISWYNEAGVVCWSFFSYRLFARWQDAVLALMRSWIDWNTWERLAGTIEYELARFNYPREMADWIWENLLDRDLELRTAAREAQLSA